MSGAWARLEETERSFIRCSTNDLGAESLKP